jgi:hypothetical protein
MTTQVTSPRGQFSFPCVIKPKPNAMNPKDTRLFYSIDILFDKDTDLTDLKKAANEAVVKKSGHDKSKYPSKFKSPFKDGDEKENRPEYKGKIYMTCRADAEKQKVEVFDKKTKQLIEHESMISSGDFGHVYVNFFFYENSGNKGVSAGLKAVLLTEKGSLSSWQAFESLAEDSYQDEEQNADMFK